MNELKNQNEENTSKTDKRRNFLRKWLWAAVCSLPFISGIFGQHADAAASKPKAPEPETSSSSGLTMEGETLKTRVSKNRTFIEPLDTMIRFDRCDDNNDRAMTHEILSLLHEEKGKKSFPWTIYARLATHHVEGDACILCARLHKRGAGWSCGLHSEVFNEAPMVGIGVNIEMGNKYTGPDESYLIGANIMACGPQPCRFGIQILDNGSGIFEKGIGVNSKGPVGIDIAGKYDKGLHMHGNDIWVDEGTSIVLDGKGQIRLRYKEGKIEFLNGEKCVGFIKTDGEEHAI